MSPLQALAPDQRAVLELLLRQGRSYAELSELLGIPEPGVRSRAHAALAALAPERQAPIGETIWLDGRTGAAGPVIDDAWVAGLRGTARVTTWQVGDDFNLPARRVYERCGFQPVGTLATVLF